MKKTLFIILLLVGISVVAMVPKIAQAYTPGSETNLTQTLFLHNSDSTWIKKLFGICQTLLNISLVAGLLLASFATILKLDIDSYTIKKMVTKAVFAAVVGNLTLTIAAVLSTIVDNLTAISIFKWSSMDILSMMGTNAWDTIKAVFSTVTSGMGLAAVAVFVLGSLANFVVLIVVIAVTFMMSLRPWIVILAAAVGPLAMGLSILPFAEPLYKKWYKILIFWIFYPLIANFFIYIIRLIPHLT